MAKSFVFNPFTSNFDAISAVTLTTAGSTPNSSGASLSADQALTLQPADGSNPGLVSTTTQTFAGQKTFSTGLTGTLTGHATLDLPLTGGTLSGVLDLGSNNINNLLDPTSPQQGATKNYVDLVAAALQPQESVIVATTANLVGVYNNGASGVGATFTVTATGVLTIDGVATALGNRILVKDQSVGFQNGIYTVTTAGAIGIATILTRATNYNTAAEMNAAGLIPVLSGTLNSVSSWQQVATIITVGTTALVFTEFTANPSLYLIKANNLSDVSNTSTAFNNISPITSVGDLIIGTGVSTAGRLAIGGNTTILTSNGTTASWQAAPVGTVTSVSIVSTNGFAGTVATATSTPAITITTTVTGVLKGNGTAISAATSGTDYSAGTSALGTGILKSTTGTGALTIAVAADFPTLNQNTSGTAANVTGVVALANGGTANGSLAATAGGVLYTDGTKVVNVGAGTSGNFLKSNGASPPTWAPGGGSPVPPTVSTVSTTFHTGGFSANASGTYTTPVGVLYIRVQAVGGGGGGGGAATNGGGGGTGGTTTFGTTLISCTGGTGGSNGSSLTGGPGGGSTLGTGPVGTSVAGGSGSDGNDPSGTSTASGGNGGTSFYGGSGGNGSGGGGPGVGKAAAANSGSGGGGGGGNTTGINAAGGGGAGGFVDAIITSPLSTYAYAVGALGAGGTAGTSGSAGGAGGSGYIQVTEYYQ